MNDKLNITNELRGGLASATVTLPIAIAFGQASGLGALAGLYSAMIITLLGALLGGTPVQISSPVGVVLVAVIYMSNQQINFSAIELGLDPTDPEVVAHSTPYLLLIFFLAGLFQLLFGFLRIGSYVNYIPYPVISGFSTGIGLLIIVLQIKDIFRLDLESHQAYNIAHLNADQMIRLEHALVIVIVTLVILVVMPRFVKVIPASLAALVIVSFLPYLFQWENFRTIGAIELSSIHLDASFLGFIGEADRMVNCVIFAITLAIINSINTLLTSLAADHATGVEHNSNRELFGQGIGNSISSLFGGMPGGGAIACTITNIHYGGRTRWSAVISAIALLGMILLAGKYIGQIPVTVLDGILLYIGYLIIDKKAIRQIRIMPWMDTLIMLIVVVLTTMGELVYAVITGVSLASIYFMKRMADTVELDTKHAKVDRLVDNLIDTFEDPDTFKKHVLVKNIKGPIFFGFASRFSESLKRLTDIQALVFNMESVSYIDQSGLYTLEREIQKLKSRDVAIYLTELDKKTSRFLAKSKLVGELIPEKNLFPSVEECIMKLYEKINQKSHLDYLGLHVPPAFTPNQDGINDVWKIENIQNYPQCKVTVETREGERVFCSEGYQEPWDGMVNERFLNPDKYKYRIDLNDEEERSYEGYVSIFR
ncbi:MAG: SulP family inorganic anion transporter [Bacteroidota bacterium]